MSPAQLNQLAQTLKGRVCEIQTAWMVVDDSQLTKSLAEYSREDNMYLVAVVPNYGISGASADSYRPTTQGLLFVLEKTDYSELSQEELVQVFDRTYIVAQKIINELMEEATAGCSSFLRNLYPDSIRLEPEWRKADCNGWSISFDIE